MQMINWFKDIPRPDKNRFHFFLAQLDVGLA